MKYLTSKWGPRKLSEVTDFPIYENMIYSHDRVYLNRDSFVSIYANERAKEILTMAVKSYTLSTPEEIRIYKIITKLNTI